MFLFVQQRRKRSKINLEKNSLFLHTKFSHPGGIALHNKAESETKYKNNKNRKTIKSLFSN